MSNNKYGVRSASARPDGSVTVLYKNGYRHREGKFNYLKEKPLTWQELNLVD